MSCDARPMGKLLYRGSRKLIDRYADRCCVEIAVSRSKVPKQGKVFHRPHRANHENVRASVMLRELRVGEDWSVGADRATCRTDIRQFRHRQLPRCRHSLPRPRAANQVVQRSRRGLTSNLHKVREVDVRKPIPGSHEFWIHLIRQEAETRRVYSLPRIIVAQRDNFNGNGLFGLPIGKQPCRQLRSGYVSRLLKIGDLLKRHFRVVADTKHIIDLRTRQGRTIHFGDRARTTDREEHICSSSPNLTLQLNRRLETRW